jgi:hypothetical protein
MNKVIAPAFAPGTIPSPALNLSPSSAVAARKAMARTALVGLSEPARALLTECFRQFGIEPVPISADAAERLHKEKFEACVLGLGKGADLLMEAARSSRSNSRCILYGVGGNAQQALQYSKYGINAIFHEPLERQAALKLIRATRMLVLHEFRRYVRIPVMTEVSVVGDKVRFNASSIEMSTGGMSLRTPEEVPVGTNVEVSFSLLTLPRMTVKGAISWRKPKLLGVRFDQADERRGKVKVWVNSYLEN